MNQVEVKRRQIEAGSYIIALMNIFLFGRILGDNGIAFFLIALEGFSVVWTITTGSLSDTLGRMLRVRNAKGQYKNVMSIRKRIMILQGIVGIICSILFAACSGLIAESVFKVSYSTSIMMLLAPALFLRTVSSVLIGYFQGEGTELPAAVAAPLRQLLLMGFGLLFANLLGKYGEKVSNLLGHPAYEAMYGGIGIAVAIDVTELLILLFLILITFGNRNTLQKRDSEGMRQTDSFSNTVRILYGSMGMSVLCRLLEWFPVWVGAVFYRKSVSDVTAFAENYGLLVGKYVVICGIPVLCICLCLISVQAKTMGTFRKGDRSARLMFQSGLHIGVVQALFFTVFATVMAEQLAGLICKTNAETVARMLRLGSILILLVVVSYYFSRFLMFAGKKYHLLGCLGLMDIVFVITVSVLLNAGKAGIMALLYAAMAAVGLECVALGLLCCRLLRTGIEWIQVIAIPALAACVVGLILMFLGKGITPHLGNPVTLIVSLLTAVLVYWVILLLFRSFREQELKYIPGGSLIRAIGQTLRVF